MNGCIHCGNPNAEKMANAGYTPTSMVAYRWCADRAACVARRIAWRRRPR